MLNVNKNNKSPKKCKMGKFFLLLLLVLLFIFIFHNCPISLTASYVVDDKLCISCELCISQCPKEAIYIKNDTSEMYFGAFIIQNKCITCGACKDVCPNDAIKIK